MILIRYSIYITCLYLSVTLNGLNPLFDQAPSAVKLDNMDQYKPTVKTNVYHLMQVNARVF